MTTPAPGTRGARFYAAIGLIALIGALITKLFFIGNIPDAEKTHSALNSLAIAGGVLFLTYAYKLRKLRRQNGG